MHYLNSAVSIDWRASLVPAAAVIPAPVAYTNIAAVKKLVVDRRGGSTGGPLLCPVLARRFFPLSGVGFSLARLLAGCGESASSPVSLAPFAHYSCGVLCPKGLVCRVVLEPEGWQVNRRPHCQLAFQCGSDTPSTVGRGAPSVCVYDDPCPRVRSATGRRKEPN